MLYILVCLLVALVHQIVYIHLLPFSYVFALEEYEKPT
jgi:hypothetical protein